MEQCLCNVLPVCEYQALLIDAFRYVWLQGDCEKICIFDKYNPFLCSIFDISVKK